MMIDQRNAGASGSSNAGYPVDRWQYYTNASGSKGTWQQNAGSVTPPEGFTHYLGFTSTSSYTVGSGELFQIFQAIEGYNVSDLDFGKSTAKTITLSFWVRSSLTGTFGASVFNSSIGTSRSYPFTYTISSANTWEQKTVTIAGDTFSQTWNTTNTRGLVVSFGLGAGSTYSGTAGAWATGTFTQATGTVSVVGTSGATFYITGVQLEKGSTATSFDYRPYGTELNLCERYMELCTGAHYNSSVTNGQYYGGGVNFRASKRATPTVTRVADTALAGNNGFPYAETINVQGFRSMCRAGSTSVDWSTIYKAECEL
jgi:hypothetical protein